MSITPANALQAWGVLEKGEGNIQLARQLFKCAVKADPASEASWLVSAFHSLQAVFGAAAGGRTSQWKLTAVQRSRLAAPHPHISEALQPLC